MNISIDDNFNLFDIEKDMKNSKQKKLMLIDNDNFITVNLHLDESKVEALKSYFNEKYKYIKKVVEKNVLLKKLDEDYSYNDDNVSREAKISNKRTETKKEKISLIRSREIHTNYGDIEYTYSYKPEARRLLQSINHPYINLVDLYNYIISCKGLDYKMRKSTIGPDMAISLIGYKDLIFAPNEKEKSMSNADLKEIINRIFDCFIIDKIEKQPIINGNISININLPLEELIALKAKLILAKNNIEIINSDIIYTEENKINKILKKEK